MQNAVESSPMSTMPATGEGGRPVSGGSGSERSAVPFWLAALRYETLYTYAVPSLDVQTPACPASGTCELNVTVPKMVIADVTTCSVERNPRYQPFLAASALCA